MAVSTVRIGDWLSTAARFHPDRTSLITDERRTTFGELNSRVNRLADGLSAAGVRAGERIALFATDSVEYVETMFASLKLGCTYVPLNARLSEPELCTLLRAARPACLFVGERYREAADRVRDEVPALRTLVGIGERRAGRLDTTHAELVAAGRDVEPDADVHDDDIVGIAFTSGTTGTPKGVLHSQRVVKHFTWQTFIEARITPGSVSYSPAPLYHNGGWLYVLAGVARGFTSLISPEFDARTVLAHLQSGRLNRCFLVPTMISALLELLELPEAAGGDYSALEGISYGAAPMSPALLRRAMEVFGCEFINMFGAGTEAGLQTILGPEEHRRALAGEEHLLASIGKPTCGVDLRLVDAEGNDVPDGEVGEIVTRSDAVMSGYLDDPDGTAGKIVDGWYHGGDLAWRDAEGYLYLSGRSSDTIIRGGENIYPAEVESVLAELPGVLDVAVVGVPDEHWGEVVRAHLVLREGAELDREAAVALCRSRLAAYKVPAEFRVEPDLPRNATGKILKRALRLRP